MGNLFAYIIFVALFIWGMVSTGHELTLATRRSASVNADIFRVSRVIAETNKGTCQEQNLEYYWWFRSKGYAPLVMVGKKLGQAHLWLQVGDTIYDATDWRYNGKSVAELKDVYKVGNYEKL